MNLEEPYDLSQPQSIQPQSMLNESTTSDTMEEISRVDEVYNAILLKIIRAEIPGGQELKSTQLSTQLGVSRTPVIQALARLGADGIITQERNYRARVRQGAENWLVEIHELRLLLEPFAAEWAATRITAEALNDLQKLAAAAEPGSQTDWMQAARNFDFALHLTIADYCGNLPVQQSIHKCWSYKKISYDFGSDTPETIEQGLREHIGILNALRAQDSEMAKAAMLLHLRTASHSRSNDRIV